MTAASRALDALKRVRPEWTPWLTVVAEACEQASDPVWDAAVPPRPILSRPLVPLLVDASIRLPDTVLRRSLERLIRRASASGSAPMATLAGLLTAEPDAVALFAASVSYDTDVVKASGSNAAADSDALQAVITLWSVPFLQACHRQWAGAIPENWAAPYCPICASRPAFVEIRGIERTRHARCGRCGAEWYVRMLHCLYCGNDNHEHLVTLVPQSGAPTIVIEACTRCRGYIKTYTRLQGCAPGAVYVEDLASVDHDLAALDAGYTRPQGAGCRLAVTVHAQTARPRLLSWSQ